MSWGCVRQQLLLDTHTHKHTREADTQRDCMSPCVNPTPKTLETCSLRVSPPVSLNPTPYPTPNATHRSMTLWRLWMSRCAPRPVVLRPSCARQVGAWSCCWSRAR